MDVPASLGNTAFPLLVAGLLLGLNAFFVLAEFAIVKVRASRMEELARQGSLRASLVRSILKELDAYLSAIQLGITMASLGLGWIGEPAMARLLKPVLVRLPVSLSDAANHTLSFGVAFALITFLHVVAGELAPKSIAIRHPTRAALWSAVPLRIFHRLCYLPMVLLNGASNALLRLMGLRTVGEHELAHSDEELRILLSYAQEHGSLPLPKLLLFENLFDFGNTTVKEVMTPAASIAFLQSGQPWKENSAVIAKRKHSRYPLVGNGLSDVKGIVHLKDIVLSPDPSDPDLDAIKRAAAYVPEEVLLEKALGELRKKRSHLALAQNKSGQVTGLITLEDLLEELVGEIQDEFEAPPPGSLSDAIVPEAIETRLQTEDKAEVIRVLLQRLSTARPELNFQEAWDLVWKREQTLTSGMGSGLALPHGRLASLEKPLIAVGRSPKGIEFDSPDKKPVHLVFLILTPIKDPGAQLRLLAKIAALASNNTFRRNLRRAQSPRDVMEVVLAFEQSVAE